MKSILTFSLLAASMMPVAAQTFKHLKFGDMDQWATRTIHESGVIGGNTVELYEIGPTTTIDGNKAWHNQGGSPWGTSNVYAKVHGVSKGSATVYPDERPGHGKCAKLCSQLVSVKVLGVINMDVMVAGSIFLGRMLEPVTGTNNPYQNMDMGVPYTSRPKSVQLDYKLQVPADACRVKSSGFGMKKTIPGRDHAVVFVYLQRRWEDPDGNIHAMRVGTAAERFSNTTGWTDRHRIPIHYGDASTQAGYDSQFSALRTAANAYYSYNSKGQLVPVVEEGWDDADASPTHAVMMISSGSSEAYIATPGMTFWVDNVGFVE